MSFGFGSLLVEDDNAHKPNDRQAASRKPPASKQTQTHWHYPNMTNNFTSRIPLSLQAVFLSSNRGHEVHKPPPDQSAFKTLTRRFIRKRSARDLTVATATSNSTGASIPSKVLLQQAVKKNGGKPVVKAVREPQDVLDELLYPRNYDTTPHSSINTGYCFKPSELQLASYTVHLKELVSENHIQAFSDIIDSGLVSNNPCNQFSESLLHMTARRGHVDQARALLRNGACPSIADDYGRTPLHDLCWCPNSDVSVFELADLLLQQDSRLFYIKDKRGNVPLDYIKDPVNKEAWCKFLESKVDVYWPPLSLRQGRPPLCFKKPNSVPVTEPTMANNLKLAAVIASGQLDASDYTDSDEDDDDEEMDENIGKDIDTSDLAATEHDDSSECDDDSDDDSDSDSEMDFDDEELLNDMVFRMSAVNC